MNKIYQTDSGKYGVISDELKSGKVILKVFEDTECKKRVTELGLPVSLILDKHRLKEVKTENV